MGQNTLLFGQKKIKLIHESYGCMPRISCFLGSSPPFSFYSSTLRVCKMETPNFWAPRGAWLQGREAAQHPGSGSHQGMWLGFNGFALFLLPSCSSFQVLDIFQTSNKIWFEKQTLSAPSKGKKNVHLNENPIFH